MWHIGVMLRFFLVGLMLAVTGCTFGSNGISAPGFHLYVAPGDGYQNHHTGLPVGSLGCEITWPEDFTSIPYENFAWIYGVVFREGTDLGSEPWDGPEWYVDNQLVPSTRYQFDNDYPEIWVRFPLDSKEIGVGIHDIELRVWDRSQNVPFRVSNRITIKVE
jgi:hypothetical protein